MIHTWTLTCNFFICCDSSDLINCLHCYDANDPVSGGTVMVNQWENELPNCHFSTALDNLSLNSSTARSPASLMMSNDVKPSKTHWTCWWVWSWGICPPYRCSAFLTHWCGASAIKLPSAPILKNDVHEAHLREKSPMQKAARSQRKRISSSLPLSSAAFSSQLIWDLLSVCVQSQHGGFGKEKQPCTGIKRNPTPPQPLQSTRRFWRV